MAAASESDSLWFAGLVRLRNTCHDFAVEKSDDNGGLRLAAASESKSPGLRGLSNCGIHATTLLWKSRMESFGRGVRVSMVCGTQKARVSSIGDTIFSFS